MKKILLLACGGIFLSSSVEADVCSDIARLTNEAKSNFSRIRGAFIEAFEDAKYYDASVKLAGASKCEIVYDDDGASYGCRWIGQNVAAYESVVSQVGDCLSGFRVRSSTSENYLRVAFRGDEAYVSVRYLRRRNEIKIRISS